MKKQLIKLGGLFGMTLWIAFILYPFQYDSFAQTKNSAQRFRDNSLRIVAPKTVSAPGYCESYGGSTYYERIESVSVVEKAGNSLEITVNVWISNPYNCVSGEP